MRLLVVEDEVRLAEGLKRGLEAEGFAVDVAHDGTDGLWLARENRYDAIVLDIMLPGMNGYQVCRTLRDEGDLDADPHAHREGRRVGPGRGARHRRRRLPDEAVLVRGARRPRAGAASAAAPAPRPAVLEAGDLRLDPATRARAARRREIDLTAREFARARVPHAPAPARSSRSARSSTASGTTTSTATRTSSRSTSAPAPQGRPAVRPREHRDRARRRLPAGGRRWLSRTARAPARPDGRGSVRTRITLVATSVVAIALVLGAVGFWLTLRTSLYDGLRSAAEQDAAVIAERIESDGARDRSPNPTNASFRSSTSRAPCSSPASRCTIDAGRRR